MKKKIAEYDPGSFFYQYSSLIISISNLHPNVMILYFTVFGVFYFCLLYITVFGNSETQKVI